MVFLEKCYLLAGGKSSRLGQDKGLFELKNKALIAYTLERVSTFSNKIAIITTNEQYNQFGVPLIKDLYPEKGPLGGLHAALSDAKSEYIWLFPCDMPFLDYSLMNYVMQQFDPNCAIHITQHQNQPFPVFGIFAVSLCNVVEDYIQNNKLKMMDFIQNQSHNVICTNHFPDLYYKNVNTKESIKEIESYL